MTSMMEIQGADPEQLHQLWSSGLDHNDDPVESFTDTEGGWPLRCCLTDSVPGDELAIVGWSPFPWRGPFAETGPIVIHAHPCGGTEDRDVPAQFLTRRQLVRPYGYDRRIAYDHLAVVDPDGSLPSVLEELLRLDDIDFVHVRNLRPGCYSFTARRAGAGRQA